ncbi:MAG: DNA topoisomerase IV subunit A [Myxococcales bacterium]|nr:DNA topoisomerase IV subunit A [Myxococcales bacterium]
MDLFTDDDGGTGGGSIAPIRLHEATRHRYLNYALSVITSRALPDVRDGLKPVQRRILFGMYKDLKLRHDSRFLKSARVVGEVMGKYHPHGDTSIYDAMVRMAQPFSLRYPLVDGQGNFGSIDGDAPAAMRYTEARLQALAEDLLSEITRGTVDWRPTYDGQLSEPVVLPAQVPNLLINGASGIAVGMATNIPPHHLGEVVAALIALIDDPTLTTAELCRHVRGPDFPTGGEILSTPEEILAVYETGQGPIKLRGAYTVETIARKRHVVITSVPYGVNKGALVEKIAQHVIAKNVPQIVDVRDESTDDVRIVLELKRGAEPEVAMAYLYKHTPLQQNFNVNLTCLVPTEDPQVQAPARVGLRDVLREFLDFRLEVVTRRLRHRLAELEKAIHRLEGFETIFDALDEIIALIRASEGKADAARQMMDRFDLDEEQTDAILELKLYRLAKLEILLVRQELDDKRGEAARIEAQLGDVDARWAIVRSELLEIASAYNDDRRTTVVGPAVEADFAPEAYIIREMAWVIVSRLGRLKRQKGFSEIESIRVPDGDAVGWVLRTDTRQTVTFYTQFGSAYVMRVDDIAQTTGYGEPVQSFFNFADGERIIGVTCSDEKLYPIEIEVDPGVEPDGPKPPYAVAITRGGKASRFPHAAHAEPSTKNGRRYMSLADGDEVVMVQPSTGAENVALATEQARALLFAVTEIPVKENAVRGVNAIRLADDDLVLGYALATARREGLVVHTNRGAEKIIRATSYEPASRGGKGKEVIQRGRFVRCEVPVEVYRPAGGEAEVDEENGEGER